MLANTGFSYTHQFINVDDYQDIGEICVVPHYWQNLAEAEFAVAIFMYMRIKGWI